MSHQFDQLLSNISGPLLSQTLYMYGHRKYQMHIIPTKVIQSSLRFLSTNMQKRVACP